jgi:hypothetical protein
MTDEQRQRWKESGLFPVERWDTGPGSTPLVCPLPNQALVLALRRIVRQAAKRRHVQEVGKKNASENYSASLSGESERKGKMIRS